MSGVLHALAVVPIHLDVQAMTIGTAGSRYGYSAGTAGDLSDGTSDIYGGAGISGLYYEAEGIWFIVAGARANSGWSTLTIGDLVLTRASAGFFAGDNTLWDWASATNPFSAIGTQKVIVWD